MVTNQTYEDGAFFMDLIRESDSTENLGSCRKSLETQFPFARN